MKGVYKLDSSEKCTSRLTLVTHRQGEGHGAGCHCLRPWLPNPSAGQSLSHAVSQPAHLQAGGPHLCSRLAFLHLDTVQPPVQVSGEYRSVQASRWPSFTRTYLTGTCPWLVLGLWHMLSTWL